MSEIDSEVQLVEVTKENFLEFLKKARERILIAKPGYYKEEVITLIELATKKRVKCTVYVDPDESAYSDPTRPPNMIEADHPL